MQLHRLHPDKASDMWPVIQGGVEISGINPTWMIGHVMAGKSEVLLCKDPRCWVFFAMHGSDLEEYYRVFRVTAGWSLDNLNGHAEEFFQALQQHALGQGANYIHFNDRSPFLMKLLAVTGGQVWQSLR